VVPPHSYPRPFQVLKKAKRLAVSLCRVLLGTVNLSDALLLTTILSEDLDVLQRRGYEGQFSLLKPNNGKVILILQNTVRQEDLNNSGLTGTVNPCSSSALGTSNYPSTTQPSPESVLDPKAEARAEPTSGHSLSLGGSEAAPGSFSSYSGLSFVVTKATNNICDAIHKVRSNIAPRSMVSSVEPSGTATLIRPSSLW